MTSLPRDLDRYTAADLDLHGVNATVFARLVEQTADGRGWVCSCVLRLPHIGGSAAHSRIADIRTALRPLHPDYGKNPVPKQATKCGKCLETARLCREFGRTPSRTYAYRIAPALWPLLESGQRSAA